MTESLTETDELSRLTFRPRDFPLEDMGCLCLKQNLHFNEKTGRKESVNCNRLVAKYPDDLHAQGQNIAFQKNQQRLISGKPQDFEYAGFSLSQYSSVINISESGHGFTVYHAPENDNNAHCHIELVTAAEIDYNKGTAKVIKDRLYKIFGPLIAP